jgi:hypothetical protein
VSRLPFAIEDLVAAIVTLHDDPAKTRQIEIVIPSPVFETVRDDLGSHRGQAYSTVPDRFTFDAVTFVRKQ